MCLLGVLKVLTLSNPLIEVNVGLLTALSGMVEP
jgi:hypothetical protein